MTIAVSGTSAVTSARRLSARLVCFMPLASMVRGDAGVRCWRRTNRGRAPARLREIAFEQAPHSRLKLPVVRLAVPLPEPGEDAEYPCVPLRRKRPVGALELSPWPVAAM